MPRGLSSYCTPASCDVSAGCVGQPDVQLCNDANTCTKDACGSTGCTHLAQSGPCNDGNPCTPSDACSGGKCLGTGVLSCNDNNVCTLDSCKAGVGCQNAPVGLGAACSDGDVCNGAEACESGVCKPGNILDCDDKDACTTDSCNKTSGCKHAIAMKPWTFLQNGMDGGAFTAIDADPLDAKVVYAGGKGLFRSADGGASWSALSGLASRRISSVKVDLATPGTLYITGVYPVGYYLPDGSDGFFASTDSGKTWKAKNTGLTGATLNRIVLDPADSASLYLVTDKGLFHSSDTGGSWQIVSGMPTVYVAGLAIDPTGKTLLVLGGKPGSATTADVYRSLNGGATFTALGTLPANLGFPRDIAVGPTGTWFAVCSDGGVLRSSDAGSTWAPSSSGMAKTWYGSPASMQWLAMDPGSGSRLWVGTNAGIHRSSDGGVTWKWVQAGLPDLANQGMVAHSDPTDGLFVLTSGRGVFRSDDLGATWIAKSQGLQGVIVSVVAVVPGSTSQLYAMAAFGGQIYRSQDGGKTWADTLGTVTGTPISLSVAADGPGVVYAGIGANGGPKLFKTVDFGKTWKATALAPCTTTADYMRVTADPTVPGRVLASSDACGLSWSEDGGANWTAAVGPFGKLPVRVTFDADTPDRVLTASYGLYESKDGGKNWLQVGNGPGLQGAQLAVTPGKPLVLLATGYTLDGVNQPVGRVSRSLDGGKTWQQTSADFDRGQPAGIAFDPTRPGYVYVGTANTNGGKYWDGGVFVSGDGGLTWTFGVSGKVTNLALLGGTVLGVGGNYGSNASFTGVGQTELVCQ